MDHFTALYSQGLLSGLEETDHYKDTPERRLLVAVMHKAVTDFLCDRDIKAQQDAEEWFLAEFIDTPQPFSFQYICLELNLDYDHARKHIIKLLDTVQAA